MEGANWDFNAPTFIDFVNDEHTKNDGVDDYFDYDHESADKTTEDSNVLESPLPQSDLNDSQKGSRRETFETPKHSRLAVMPNQGSSASPPCTIESEGIRLPVINNEDVVEVGLKQAIVSQTSYLQMPLEAATETSNSDLKVTLNLQDKKPEGSMQMEVEYIFNNPENEVKDKMEDNKMVLGKADTLSTRCTVLEMSVDEESEVINEESTCNSDAVCSTSNPQLPTMPAAMRDQYQELRSVMPRRSRTPQGQRRQSQRLEKLRERRRSGKKAASGLHKSITEPPLAKKKKSVQLSLPLTPTVLKHQPYASVHRAKSREELELEEIEQAKFEQQQRLKESRRSFKAAMHPPPPRAPSPAKRTKVKEFKFATDKRMKFTSSMQTRSSKMPSEVSFTRGLRQHPPSPTYVGRTVPKPFKLTETKKRKLNLETAEDQGYTFKPMAKAVLDFQRTRSASQKPEKALGPLRAKRSLLTEAKTPKLESKSRKRPISVTSAKEKEEQEVEEMKQYQFKAKPANQKILKEPESLPKVERHQSTEVQEFHLSIDKRIEERPKHEKTPSPSRDFKARPVPKAVIRGPSQAMKAEPAKVTIPQSPAFQLKNRAELTLLRKEYKERAKENTEPKLKLGSSIVTKLKKQQVVPEKKSIVEVKPFSFHDRDVKRFADKEKKIQEIHDAERAAASAFRATPMLFDTDCVTAVPSKQVRPTTKVEPFHLASEERGVTKTGQWKADLESECRALKERTIFRANTDYVRILHGDGFKPVIAKKCTDKFDEFSLHTNTRALKRQEFDERQKQVEASALLAAEESKRIAEDLAEEERKKARKLAEHKAAAVRRYKQLEITASTKELTDPQSPNFSDRFCKKVFSE